MNIAPMPGVCPETTKYWTEEDRPPPGRAIAELAGSQHGIVTLAQLAELGLAPSSVRSRVAAGQLHRMHRGVYAVGHRIVNRYGHWLAAVLACGVGAVLSHRSAAALWGIRPTSQASIDVTSPQRSGKGRLGITVHSGATLLAADVAEIDGIPCTSLARTLLDLAEVVHGQALERAVHEAEILRVFDGRAVAEILRRARGRRGAVRLEAATAEGDFAGPGTRSELEDGFLAFCTRNGLPRPENNPYVDTPEGSREVDFLWRSHRLVVESDGRRFHDTPRAFESDHRKELLLDAGGWECVRATWRQVTRDDPLLVRALRRRLAAPPHL